jgi:hypothetical protein
MQRRIHIAWHTGRAFRNLSRYLNISLRIYLQSGRSSKGRSPPSSGSRPRAYQYSMPHQQPLYTPFSQIPAQGSSAALPMAAYPYYGFTQNLQPPLPPPTSTFTPSSARNPRPFQGTCNICSLYGHKAVDCRKK